MNKIELFQKLFEEIYKNGSNKLKPQYEKIYSELKKEGYTIEHGYGYYLHCPDGTKIILDYWNEKNE
jgi:hypothetical protein